VVRLIGATLGNIIGELVGERLALGRRVGIGGVGIFVGATLGKLIGGLLGIIKLVGEGLEFGPLVGSPSIDGAPTGGRGNGARLGTVTGGRGNGARLGTVTGGRGNGTNISTKYLISSYISTITTSSHFCAKSCARLGTEMGGSGNGTNVGGVMMFGGMIPGAMVGEGSMVGYSLGTKLGVGLGSGHSSGAVQIHVQVQWGGRSESWGIRDWESAEESSRQRPRRRRVEGRAMAFDCESAPLFAPLSAPFSSPHSLLSVHAYLSVLLYLYFQFMHISMCEQKLKDTCGVGGRWRRTERYGER
jgi:hypothetical protein